MKDMITDEIDFCALWESRLETARVLKLIDGSLTEKGRKALADMQHWIDANTDKYLTITGTRSSPTIK